METPHPVYFSQPQLSCRFGSAEAPRQTMGLNQLGWGASAVTGAVVALGRLLDNQRSSNWAEFHPGIKRRGADILNIVPDNAGAACTVFPAVFASAVTGAVVALGRLLDNQRSSNWAEFHPGIQRRGADILNIVPDNGGPARS